MDQSEKSFLGKGWAFPPAFDIDSKTVLLVSEEKDIEQSIRIILGTIPGERIMNPKFGCDLIKHVFETTNATSITILKDLVYDALLFYEPRIKSEKINIITDKIMEGKLLIHISYRVIITNTRSNIVFPYYLTEGTNL
ncbi:GPW/gp25 family protein [Cognataquiflexum aquatile]|uniref:GPW/gp25 family protein n=1 Tax=Cognataquiflexum aquatile TaxID=2249427 RepID=UPI000DEB794B|nr:GPW/gp25 family protein [Cognataquiflexum aquatile]